MRSEHATTTSGDLRLQPDLTLSIISADNLELILPCLRSVYRGTCHINLQVYLVDNASCDGTAAAIRAEFPQVELIHNETRRGFSTNNNLVLRRGQGRYLMLLNDDTLVLDGALDRMVAFMDAHPSAGAVGSYLLNPDGSLQPASSRFPHPIVEGLWPATNWSMRRMKSAELPFEVDRVCGAAMLVRREVMDQVGVLDTAFDPIYVEEVDWCYRIKQAGWSIWSLPRAEIIHYGSQTMDRAVPRKYELLLSKKALYFRKHGGQGADSLYRVTLGFATAAKVGWWMLFSLLPSKRQMGTERMELHWYILKRIPTFSGY